MTFRARWLVWPALSILSIGLFMALPDSRAPQPISVIKSDPASPAETRTVGLAAEETGFSRGDGFHEVGDGVFETQGKAFEAQVSASEGVKVRSMLHSPTSRRMKEQSVSLKLRVARRGETVLYDRDKDPNPGDRTPSWSDGLRYHRAPGIAERYVSLKNGVELFYDLDKAPPGYGDLVLEHHFRAEGVSVMPRNGDGGGLHFSDDAGRCVLHIGQVIARDAYGRPCVAEPEILARNTALRFTIPNAWLNRAAYPVEIDPPIVVTPQFTLTESATIPTAPIVAASNSGFLVAYIDTSRGKKAQKLKARLVGLDGTASPVIQITNPPQQPLAAPARRNQAASDGTNFLVVWSENKGGIYGAIVRPDATLLPVGASGDTTFRISATSAKLDNEIPLVAFNGLQYVVAWHDRPEDKKKARKKAPIISIAMVSTDGTQITPKQEIGYNDRIPLEQLLIALHPGPDNLVLMLYRDMHEIPTQYRAQRIDPDGTLPAPEGVSLFKLRLADYGFGVPVAVSRDGDVGWNVLSTPNQTQDSAVYLHRISKEGVITRADEVNPATDGIFTSMGVGPTGIASEDEFVASWMGADVSLPGGGTGGEWLFVRNVRTAFKKKAFTKIIGKRVGADGTDYDVTPFRIDNPDDDVRRSASVASTSNRFLVAWLAGGILGADRALEIQAAVLDSAGDVNLTPFTQASLTVQSLTKPFVVPVGTEVVFDWSASTGPITDQRLYTGTGATAHPEVGTTTLTYTYARAGTFFPRIQLENDKYYSMASVRITVGDGLGKPGADATVGGSPPITNTPNVNTDLSIDSAEFYLDFAADDNDRVAITGTLNPGLLPETALGEIITGKLAEVTLFGPANPAGKDPPGFDEAAPAGPAGYTVPLDDAGDGHFLQGNGLEEIDFSIDTRKGTFSVEILRTNLSPHLVPDELTHKNPSHDRRVEIGLKVSGVDFGTARVVTLYSSTEGNSANARYFSNGTGKEDTGRLVFTKTNLLEAIGKNGESGHTATITGKLVPPNGLVEPEGAPYVVPTTGTWQFQIGSYRTVAVDVAEAVAAKRLKENKKFVQLKGAKGGDLKLFKIDKTRGTFTLQLNSIPASPGIGLPLTGDEDLEVVVDLYVALELDFPNGPIDAGGFVRIERPSARASGWKKP